MQLVFDVVVFILALCLIIWGGDKFVNSSIILAKKIKIPTVIIGATITSIGTTLPELLVTIFSAGSQAGDMAVGNALGSIIFNTCLIGGILLSYMRVKSKKETNLTYFFLFFLIILTALMSINKKISIFEAIILIFMFIVFTIANILRGKKTDNASRGGEYVADEKILKCIITFILSAVLIGTGAFVMVEKAKGFCYMAGLSETFVGLAILSFGTSLPELITTISAIRKKEAGIGIGNIVGSNVINCSLLVGLTGVIGGGSLAVGMETILITLPVAIIASLILFLPTILYSKTYKWQGICLIGLYAIYYTYLILTAVGAINLFAWIDKIIKWCIYYFDIYLKTICK